MFKGFGTKVYQNITLLQVENKSTDFSNLIKHNILKTN